jgi:hypothetical protein
MSAALGLPILAVLGGRPARRLGRSAPKNTLGGLAASQTRQEKGGRPHGTRTVRRVYSHEMSDADHRRLIEAITRYRGRVAVSGYASTLYDPTLAGWERVEFDMPNHSSQARSKERRVEVYWLNCQD